MATPIMPCGRQKHGGTHTPEYRIWNAMRKRCNTPTTTAYEHYGGRGIKVCERWNSFANFIADVGPRPDPAAQLERLDNDGDYCPENCCWVDHQAQMNNTRRNVFVEFQGLRMTTCQWDRHRGHKLGTVGLRLRRGWSIERAITTPVDDTPVDRRAAAEELAADALARFQGARDKGSGEPEVWESLFGTDGPFRIVRRKTLGRAR